MNVRLFGFLLQIYKTYSEFHDVAFGSIFHVTGRSSELSGFWTCKCYCNGTCFTWSVQRSLVHTNSYAGKGEIQFFLSCSKNRKLKCYWNFVIPTYPLDNISDLRISMWCAPSEKEKHLVVTSTLFNVLELFTKRPSGFDILSFLRIH